MSLSQIVNVSVTNASPRVTQQGFGIPLILGYHTAFPELVRFYTELSGVAADFSVADPEYKAAAAMFSQNPSPEQIAIGRRASVPTQAWEFTPVELTEGYEYSITITSKVGSGPSATELSETFTYEVGDSGDPLTATAICDGLRTAIAGATAAVTGSGTATLVLTADVAGAWFGVTVPADEALRVEETTAPGASNVNADLTSIFAADSSWYAVYPISRSAAEIASAATFCNANKRFLLAETNDYDNKDSGSTTDPAYVASNAAQSFTKVDWNLQPSGFKGAAWLGRMLPTNPGSSSWEYKTLSGVPAPQAAALTSTHKTALEAKNAGYYETIAGVNVTRNSKMADGEWMDIRRGLDWLEARIKEAVFGLMSSVEKIPYTDSGIALVTTAIDEVLRLGASRGLLVESSIQVTAPKASAVTAQNKSDRFLPDVKFSATLQGAIHSADIDGTVSV